MSSFQRTTTVFEVSEKNDHIFKPLTKEYYSFVAILENKEFIFLLKKDFSGCLIIDETSKSAITENYKYISDQPISDLGILIEIDLYCSKISDIKKTSSFYYLPIFKK